MHVFRSSPLPSTRPISRRNGDIFLGCGDRYIGGHIYWYTYTLRTRRETDIHDAMCFRIMRRVRMCDASWRRCRRKRGRLLRSSVEGDEDS